MNKCLWYVIAQSDSPEGIAFQEQHDEINFNYCRKRCEGYKSDCKEYAQYKKLEESLDGNYKDEMV